jgi:tight adherence protein C
VTAASLSLVGLPLAGAPLTGAPLATLPPVVDVPVLGAVLALSLPASRAAGIVGLTVFAGATLLLSELHWFRRRPLIDRLAPYVPGGAGRLGRPGAPLASPASVASWRELLEPLARVAGERLASSLGVTEPLAVRLERVHSPVGASEVRIRQLVWAGVGLVAGTVLAGALRLPGTLAAMFVGGGPVLAFLVVEQRTVEASERWKRHLFLELPVVAEQLGMLLGAGYSLTTALDRLARRGRGVCGQDLARVCDRIRLGVDEVTALREWAQVAGVPALHRLVGVLAMERQAVDVGRLISEEARAIRRDVHRRTVEVIRRRAQQVWVPVTVATLVPGVVFLAVPFVDALRQFSSA